MINGLLEKLGIKKKKRVFQEFESKIVDFNLSKDGLVKYAQWLHPGEFGNVVTQEYVDFFRNFLSAGDFGIDIGANEGDTTIPMALATGKDGLTLAVESNPHVFKVLAKNASLNPEKTNIAALNFAATAYDGEFTFGSGDPSFGNGGIVGFTHNKKRNTRYTFKVTGKNFDDYLATYYQQKLAKLKLIKIDTEGYDKEILKTLSKTILQCRPYLITECFGPATNDEKVELFDVLAKFDYDLYILTGWTLNNVKALERADMHGKKTFDILAIPKEKKSNIKLEL